MIRVPEEYLVQFQTIIKDYGLSHQQIEQSWFFLQQLISENKKYNLTAILDPEKAIDDHLYDSLALLKMKNLIQVNSIVDIGSGGGFPGIPLAIALPNIHFYLIEVNLKKVAFLESIAAQLGLKNVTVIPLDFRSFIRASPVKVDLFIARASLQVEEILRIFKPSSKYQQSMFLYWASVHWSAVSKLEQNYFDVCYPYAVGHKQRALCLFKKQDASIE